MILSRVAHLRERPRIFIGMLTLYHIIGDLEGVFATGSVAKKAEVSGRISVLFVSQAAHFSDEELTVFDELFGRLVVQIEVSARAIMAVRLAPVPNAPPKVIRSLAFDDAIAVASPILSFSERLSEQDVVENARQKGQGHLLAISKRKTLPVSVTDILVGRGNRDVLLSTVGNRGARFSDEGFGVLVKRAEGDDELAINVGKRAEIPRYLFRELLQQASQRVQVRLTSIHPELFVPIREIVEEVSKTIEADTEARSQWRETVKSAPPAKEPAIALAELQKRADSGDSKGVVTGLAAICGVSPEFVEEGGRTA